MKPLSRGTDTTKAGTANAADRHMNAANDARAIRSIHDALKWGDEWVAAYAALQAHSDDLAATVEQLRDQAFMLQTRAVILEAEALLLRHDVAEALRKPL